MKTNTRSYRDEGILGIAVLKKKQRTNTNVCFLFLPSARFLLFPTSRVTGLHQETQRQLPRLRWVRVFVLVWMPACKISVKLRQKNAAQDSLYLDWHVDWGKKSPTYGCLLFVSVLPA